jgi:hypothetical protein
MILEAGWAAGMTCLERSSVPVGHELREWLARAAQPGQPVVIGQSDATEASP